MTAPLHRVYLSDADYALLDAAQTRLEQDRRYQASIAGILAENAAAWERHVGSAIQASAPLSHPANLGQLDDSDFVTDRGSQRAIGFAIVAGVALIIGAAVLGVVNVVLWVTS